jgi:hypothetical protein
MPLASGYEEERVSVRASSTKGIYTRKSRKSPISRPTCKFAPREARFRLFETIQF